MLHKVIKWINETKKTNTILADIMFTTFTRTFAARLKGNDVIQQKQLNNISLSFLHYIFFKLLYFLWAIYMPEPKYD